MVWMADRPTSTRPTMRMTAAPVRLTGSFMMAVSPFLRRARRRVSCPPMVPQGGPEVVRPAEQRQEKSVHDEVEPSRDAGSDLRTIRPAPLCESARVDELLDDVERGRDERSPPEPGHWPMGFLSSRLP